MTSFEDVDTNGSGSIDRSEWDALELEDRRRRLDDEDSQRDAQRRMAWFCLAGMLAYPFLVLLCTLIGAEKAADIIGSMASIYFLSVAGVVSVFFGVTNMSKKEVKGNNG
jgi:hypothetical protein|tara:strand:+ start:25 stop:354 length:330 start_codon:yes stop_codon:yes gene_type:complete